jgi:signal transduction histidine kinase
MLAGPVRLSILAGLAALGAVGLTLALVGLGLPFLLAALVAAWAAGLVQYAASRATTAALAPAPTPDAALQQLDEYRRHTAAMRHDLRGVLSPALMMSDRLLGHADPAVQRAGNAVVRSIDRATALLAESKDLMTPEGTVVPPPPVGRKNEAPSANPATQAP